MNVDLSYEQILNMIDLPKELSSLSDKITALSFVMMWFSFISLLQIVFLVLIYYYI